MQTIGIICARQVELDAIKNLLSSYDEINIGPRSFFKGQYQNKEIILTKCGIGKVNAAITTTLLINHFNPNFIINCGVAGGYNANLLPLDVVVAKSVEDKKGKRCNAYLIPSGFMGVDIGRKSVKAFAKEIKNAQTIIWNGPLGVMENEQFCKAG